MPDAGEQQAELGAHGLGTGWSGVDMAMQATLIALVGQVDLQCLQLASGDRGKAQCVERGKVACMRIQTRGELCF